MIVVGQSRLYCYQKRGGAGEERVGRSRINRHSQTQYRIGTDNLLTIYHHLSGRSYRHTPLITHNAARSIKDGAAGWPRPGLFGSSRSPSTTWLGFISLPYYVQCQCYRPTGELMSQSRSDQICSRAVPIFIGYVSHRTNHCSHIYVTTSGRYRRRRSVG